MNPIILIPARMASTRLPGKPLAMIAGEPMIVHVWRRAVESGVGEVVVACDEQEIADAITQSRGQGGDHRPDLPSGSDRIWQALAENRSAKEIRRHHQSPGRHADTRSGALSNRRWRCWPIPHVDIGTLAAVITDEREKTDPAVVKVD